MICILNGLKDFFKGLVIGIGAVAPGVSGGAFAVMLGVYNRLTEAIANIFHDFIKKAMDLLPLSLGMITGVLVFSRIMSYLFENHEFKIKFLFIGLMLGTISTVIRDANKEGFKKTYLIPSIITFGITVAFTILEDNVINIIPESNVGIIALLICGGVIGFGTIVPGVSASFILMYLGFYEFLLDALVDLNIMILIPVGIGFVICIFIFAKLINYLFDKAYGITYYSILGFVFGSIVAIVPTNQYGMDIVFGIIYCSIGFFISYILGKTGKGAN